VSVSGSPSLHPFQVFSYPFKFYRHLRIPTRTFAQTIDCLTEAAQILAQSRGEAGQGQGIFMSNEKGYH
jgi:hypothetical protein